MISKLQRLNLALVLMLVSEVGVHAAGAEEREVIGDNHFRGGLILWEAAPGKHVKYGELRGIEQGRKPVWGLSQWSSKFPVEAGSEVLRANSIVISNPAKKVVLGGDGVDLTLGVNSRVEYGERAREASDPWVHLLVEQEFSEPPFLTKLDAAKFHLEARLIRSKNLHGTDDDVSRKYDASRHAAQFQVFFTVQNRNRKSAGFGDILWFGIPVYDYRYEHVPEFKAKDFGGTEKFIFTPAGTNFTNASAHDGDWITLDRDLLPLMREALQLAWAKGFLSASKNAADYAIGGMNIGWELPGTFDVEIETRNLSLVAVEKEKRLPMPGETLFVQEHVAFIIPAETASNGEPWVWYAPTLRGLPGPEERWMFERFTRAGIAIAGIDVGESYGSAAGRKLYSALYEEMVRRGYSKKPVLLGRSRGGLMTLAWAIDNAEKVGGFAGIYPVSNVTSYPGIANAAPAYGMSAEELEAHLKEQNPVDHLEALAKAGVPLFAIHGDSDKIVPLEANSGLLRDRYEALGGSMQLIIPPGQGHNMWNGFFQCEELVEFVKSHAK